MVNHLIHRCDPAKLCERDFTDALPANELSSLWDSCHAKHLLRSNIPTSKKRQAVTYYTATFLGTD